MDLKNLENQRLYILKRLGILKFLSILEALLIAFLIFVFIKDILIAIIASVFVGIFFFNFTSKKLKLAKKDWEIKVLNLFLRRIGAKFKKEGLSQKDFLKLELIENLKEFQSQNCFELKDFKIYDIQFLDLNKNLFCGILLEIIKTNKNTQFKDKEKIYTKLKHKNFTLDHIFSKQNYYLIATLSNPFFIDFKKDLANNLKILEKNLDSIKNKFL
ncbi:poly(A) polymerase [Campylobacter hepaticus]|uniref:Poly(A) polymerase n=1 Tax=Campylobacter hepaticus TaxID=1813019 RepID=A0A424YZ97_9BACT|nr:poly(A) polymerase [Campylobacter hepaticus]MDX2331224.1 poly(A) polymerase [Campylobacter hepaticus]MDX2371839.1 poly(A) polymerase [Campylobacter hepaticus]MDX2397730.1 poly(A) polymerase [Campylobacter hepaticus]MDX5508997.1 poly(A) polymerase [Campylobacter hepaticus]RQD68566.1 poly(A) polymerase [Campylobacter hepaticus]